MVDMFDEFDKDNGVLFSNETCGTCCHKFRQYDEQNGYMGSVGNYCRLILSGRSRNGYFKIKCKQVACERYKKKEE